MVTDVLKWMAAFITATISSLGYFGVFLLMAIESAAIPLPSEIIMPFSGYLVFRQEFTHNLRRLSCSMATSRPSPSGAFTGSATASTS